MCDTVMSGGMPRKAGRIIMKRIHMVVRTAAAFAFGTHIMQMNPRAGAENRQEIVVVGGVAGYECRGAALSSGAHIDMWTNRPEDAICSCRYLFTVVTPAKYRGKMFYVHDVGPALRPPSPGRLFRPGTRYRFKMTIDSTAEHSPWLGSVRLLPGVAREVSITKEEADAQWAEFEKREAFLRSRMAGARRRMEREDVEDDYRESLRKDNESCEAEIRYLEDKRKSITEELREATDDFPDIYELKWKLAEEDGWKSVPRVDDVDAGGEPDDGKKDTSPSSGDDTQKTAPQE